MSRTIPLTQGKTAIIDDCDYESVVRFKWHTQHGGVTVRRYYAFHNSSMGRVGGKTRNCWVNMQNLIMRPMRGFLVDHIDHDGLNNRRYNLRICTVAQNNRNQRKLRNCSSKYKGVTWVEERQMWHARIITNGRRHHLYYGKDEREAARRYNDAAIEHFGEFACLNVI